MNPNGKEEELGGVESSFVPKPYSQSDPSSTGYLASELEKLTEGVERVELAPSGETKDKGERRWKTEMWSTGDGVVECVELEIVDGSEQKRAKAQYPTSSEAPTVKDLANSLDEVAKPVNSNMDEQGRELILDKIRKLEEHYTTGLGMARDLGDALERYYASRLGNLKEFEQDFTS